MTRPLICFVSVVLAVILSAQLLAQAPPIPPDSKPDYSQEAYVIERTVSKVEFANDGTSRREDVVSIRVQSDAGVKHWGVLAFGYQQANETSEISTRAKEIATV